MEITWRETSPQRDRGGETYYPQVGSLGPQVLGSGSARISARRRGRGVRDGGRGKLRVRRSSERSSRKYKTYVDSIFELQEHT